MSHLSLVVLASLAFLVCAFDPRTSFKKPVRHCTGSCQQAANASLMINVKKLKEKEWNKCREEHMCPRKVKSSGATECVNGFAGEYPCSNVDLLAFVAHADLGAAGHDGNDIWGWTDPETKKEYALAGTTIGTSFVDVTNPTSPCVLGFLRSTENRVSSWRDIKVYNNHAFVVSEARGHGMQVYDLTQLRDMECGEIRELKRTAFYNEFGSAHNIVINEETGFAYSVGTTTCEGGLHIVNIQDPLNPQFAGCYSKDGYVHDAQCVVYKGPNNDYTNKEICYCYNEDTLTIVDVTDKDRIVLLSRTPYNGVWYTHQGWLLPNFKYLLLNDELDEVEGTNHHTRTMLWDVTEPKKPKLVNSFYSSEEVIDHNLYTLGNRAYLANYCGGLRIYDTTQAMEGGEMSEVGFFDVAPDCSTTEFFGSWSSYPYFPSGTIVVQSIERGLFVLKFNDKQ